MIGWRVTCRSDDNGPRVLATRRTFATAAEARAYAATVAASRAPRILPALNSSQPCYMLETRDAQEDARFYRSIADARAAYEKAARELARYGQAHSASLHFVACEADEWAEYPDRLLELGPRGGLRMVRA